MLIPTQNDQTFLSSIMQKVKERKLQIQTSLNNSTRISHKFKKCRSSTSLILELLKQTQTYNTQHYLHETNINIRLASSRYPKCAGHSTMLCCTNPIAHPSISKFRVTKPPSFITVLNLHFEHFSPQAKNKNHNKSK